MKELANSGSYGTYWNYFSNDSTRIKKYNNVEISYSTRKADWNSHIYCVSKTGATNIVGGVASLLAIPFACVLKSL